MGFEARRHASATMKLGMNTGIGIGDARVDAAWCTSHARACTGTGTTSTGDDALEVASLGVEETRGDVSPALGVVGLDLETRDA